MLSADSRMYSGFYQYSAEIIPFVVAASALGAGAVARAARVWKTGAAGWMLPAICGFILVASGVDTYRTGFSPLARGYLIPSPGRHQEIENRLLAAIPGSATVAAADEIVPHLSDRYWIYKLPMVRPHNGPRARYIALDATIPSLPVRPAQLHAAAMAALASGYGVVAAQDGVLVLRLHAPRRRLPASFFSFVFQAGSHVRTERVDWGPLRLSGLLVHPGAGRINPSRPDIALETYWRASRQLPRRLRIIFYLSTVYDGRHPPFSRRWTAEPDSPTWDWLPPASWPRNRTVRAISLPLLPPLTRPGKVDVAIGVSGLGPARGASAVQRLDGMPAVVRLATVQVDP
jgi:hypothetical protein